MAEQFIGEIRIFGFGFLPRGWARCDGRILSVAEHSALFAILGKRYGGNGETNFALPNLCGRVPIHSGEKFPLGSSGGASSHTLDLSELPTHNHLAQAVTGAAAQPTPAMDLWATTAGAYAAKATDQMAIETIQPVGNGFPHENRSPFLVLNVAIATEGIFPTRS